MDVLADELRAARATLGLSRAGVAKSAGVARSTVERAEAGAASLGVDAVGAILAAVGIDLSIRAFPSERFRVRDSRHAAAVERLRSLASPAWRARAEVAAGEHGRSADLVLFGADALVHIEVELRLTDIQAQLRNAQRKRESLARSTDRPVRLVIAVADTRSNREAFRPHATLMRSQLPTGSREVMRAIRTAQLLADDGLLWLRPRNFGASARRR
jgi:transcriptional regulator with XRE-family HTH domain